MWPCSALPTPASETTSPVPCSPSRLTAFSLLLTSSMGAVNKYAKSATLYHPLIASEEPRCHREGALREAPCRKQEAAVSPVAAHQNSSFPKSPSLSFFDQNCSANIRGEQERRHSSGRLCPFEKQFPLPSQKKKRKETRATRKITFEIFCALKPNLQCSGNRTGVEKKHGPPQTPLTATI